MKLRDMSNIEICKENHLPYTMLTNVVEEDESKNRMRATSNLIAKALIATLGPYGSSTIIQDKEGRHFATKDGYDVMSRISFDDEVSRTILDLYRNTAASQVYTVGDGSTSAIVVANALYQALTDPNQIEHMKRIAPKDIVDILNDISEMVQRELKSMAIPVSEDMHQLDTIATIANNNDAAAGKLIGDIYRKVGRFGFISMDTMNKQDKDTYEIKSGVEWKRGYIDSCYAAGSDEGRVIYDKTPKVIISNSALTEDDIELVLMPLMKAAFNQENVELLIVANDYSDEVKNFFKVNRLKHMRLGGHDAPMTYAAVDIDQTTELSREKLEDLATLCGCKIYDKYKVKPAEVIAHPDVFIGKAGKVVVTPKTTQVVAMDDDKLSPDHRKDIKKKIDSFKSDLEELLKLDAPTMDEHKKIYALRMRCARLQSSTAVLYIAGKTPAERTTRQRLMEDSIFACKSALQYGYIPGGNICIPKILRDKKEAFASVLGEKYSYLPIDNIRSFFSYFIDMLANAFLESYRAVLNNSYMTEQETEETIEKCLTENKFYNLKLHRFEDFDKTDVINSVDTDIQILNSCISIIAILSTSNQFLTLNLHATFEKKEA